MVEVFSTNVAGNDQVNMLVQELLVHFPSSKINFDLEDCDKILRVEGEPVWPEKIIAVLKSNGYRCSILE